MTAPANIKQKDVERLCRGVTQAGLPVARVRVSPDGTVDIIIGANDSGLPDLDNPLDGHKHGQKRKA